MWTKEKVIKESAKFSTKKEFRMNKALSSAAHRFGVYTQITSKLDSVKKDNLKSMSRDDMKKVASKYTSRHQFAKEHSGMYKALSSKDLDEVIPVVKKLKYTDAYLLSVAKDYKSRNALKKENTAVYQAIRSRKLQCIAFKHMDPPKCAKYTYGELLVAARQYTTKNTFKLKDYGKYQAACRHPKFKEICKHMIPGKIATNYDKPMFLYIVKIVTKSTENTVYKVGITKRSYILDRFWIDYNKKDTEITVIAKTKFSTGYKAYHLEQYIKDQFKMFKYTGKSPLLKTRTTEMFTVDISKCSLNFRKVDSNGEATE